MNTIARTDSAPRQARLLRSGKAATVLRRLLSTDNTTGPALLRVVLALVMIPHGAQHVLGWFGGYGFAGTHAWMTGAVGIPATAATFAILTEFFAPFALLIGVGGRVAALAIAGFMLGAASTHLENGFFMNWNGTLPAGAEGFELHILAIAMALPVVIQGSGAWSVDRALTSRQ